jgi:hypothetical protein
MSARCERRMTGSCPAGTRALVPGWAGLSGLSPPTSPKAPARHFTGKSQKTPDGLTGRASISPLLSGLGKRMNLIAIPYVTPLVAGADLDRE